MMEGGGGDGGVEQKRKKREITYRQGQQCGGRQGMELEESIGINDDGK